VRERNPTAPPDFGKPNFIGGVVAEVVLVAFDGEAVVSQDLGEAQSEVAVGEVDEGHAARSKTTASSIASTVS
jgi:hypothetical protein